MLANMSKIIDIITTSLVIVAVIDYFYDFPHIVRSTHFVPTDTAYPTTAIVIKSVSNVNMPLLLFSHTGGS